MPRPRSSTYRARNGRLRDDWVDIMHDLVAAENTIVRQVRRPVEKARLEVAGYLRSLPKKPALWNVELIKTAILKRLRELVVPINTIMREHFNELPRQWIRVQTRTIIRQLRPREIKLIGDKLSQIAGRRRVRRLTRESERLLERRDGAVAVSIDITQLIPGIVRDLFRILGDDEMEAYLRTDEARAYLGAFQRSFARTVGRIGRDLEIPENDEDFDAYDLADDVSQTLDRMANDLERIVRTQTQSIADDTSEILGEYISPAVKWMQYTAIIDGRTCLRCSRKNGDIFRIRDSKAPKLPLHDLCRCSYVYFLGSKKDAPGVQDYDAWLRSQPAARQREILGRTRYEYFAAGMKAEQFVNNKGRIIPVKNLQRTARARQRRNRGS